MRLTLVVLALLMLAACAGEEDGDGSGDAAALTEKEWALSELDGSAPVADTAASITFTTEGVSGSTGCNTFSGSYTADTDGSMTIGPGLATTRKACVDDVMTQEFRFLELVTSTTRYEIEGDTLTLYAGDDAVAVFAS